MLYISDDISAKIRRIQMIDLLRMNENIDAWMPYTLCEEKQIYSIGCSYLVNIIESIWYYFCFSFHLKKEAEGDIWKSRITTKKFNHVKGHIIKRKVW